MSADTKGERQGLKHMDNKDKLRAHGKPHNKLKESNSWQWVGGFASMEDWKRESKPIIENENV